MTQLSRLALAAAAALAALFQAPAHASLVLTINSVTADQLSLSISGAFDSATVGDSAGYLALKNDWSAHVGEHTEMFAFSPIVTTKTIRIGDTLVVAYVQDVSETWQDNVFFVNPFGPEISIAAGTTVSGDLVLTGVGAFNPLLLSTLQLVSGFNRTPDHQDWARLEASVGDVNAVPEPGSAALLLLAGAATAAAARRRAAA